LLVGLLLLVVVITIFGFFLVRRSFPQVVGEIKAAGLEGQVEIVRDGDGIPHIFASNEHDLFFAQGYVHAQDRFWQMDFWRHIGAGRLSEMFGGSQVDTDLFLRSLGFTRLAEQELENLDPGERAILDDYADGVNSYVESRSASQISLEYAILPLQASGYAIEPWTPVNTLTWAKVMAWDLSWNMLQEIDRAVLSAGLPVERVDQLYPDYPEEHPVIVPAGQVTANTDPVGGLPAAALSALADSGERARGVWDLTGGGWAGIGSNNWVVAAPTPNPVSRCWPTTLTWRSRCRRSGTRTVSTARKRLRIARTSSSGSPSPAPPESSSGTTTTLPGE
jgi:penicillin amidase